MAIQKHLLQISLICGLSICGLSACGGGDTPSFQGVWSGSFTTLSNSCPFSVAADINPLFPMTVSVDDNEVYTVVAVTGEQAVGGQGQGQSGGFLARSTKFGNYGSIAPYTCDTIESEVGYLTMGDDKADVTVTIKFTDCSSPDSGDKKTTCGATYFGDAVRVSQG
jgi:hypothetical protein